MKKTMILIAAILLVTSGQAFAAWTDAKKESPDTAITCGTGTNTVTVPLSPRVEAYYDGSGIAYVIGSRNVQGTRTFGTSHDFTGVLYTDGVTDADASFPALPTTTGAKTVWDSDGDWSTL